MSPIPPNPPGPRAEDRPPGVSIVVPTYREAPNVRPLAERVRASLSGRGIEWELWLVDDDSRDGIEEIAAELAQEMPVRLAVRREPPRDLSLAVVEGIERSRFARIVVMDADLSHPPESIPDLLAALDGECEMVLGSRYLPGASVDDDWGAGRVWNSRLATWLARPLADCADPMSGFFAVEREAIPRLETLRPIGYKIGLELMVRGRLRVREVPIEFRDRHLGRSKLNRRQQFNYLRHLLRLYRHRFEGPANVLGFGLVGATGLVVDVACYLGLQWLGAGHRTARFLSFWVAATWNWWLNRNFTFRERLRRPKARQWAEFSANSLLGFGLSFGCYVGLTAGFEFFDDRRLLALVCGVAVAGGTNFLIASRYVFAGRAGRGPDAE